MDERYDVVYEHKGLSICTLRVATPSKGDSLNYFIDYIDFQGEEFIDVVAAVDEIDKFDETHGLAKRFSK
ncbi:hypothetical protein IAQ67_28595 (plasmid) [Paenibacillus peoriae]|uniref:Uncharacterized protein n=1 Tax=Paenibacillus peoriae TaxID=59893 RepID=A0A7H0YHE6_9BACL|nr:hypothetical protein IAQ67_28595 [Paenibacillus peoriae]